MAKHSEEAWEVSYLMEGEEILWRGKPNAKQLLTREDIFLLPFSILWGGFSVGLTVFMTARGELGNMPPVFFIFPIIGIYLLFGRFVHRSMLLRNTEYIITNRRIVIKRWTSVLELWGNNLPPMKSRIKADGSGTIEFHSPINAPRLSVKYSALTSPQYGLENLSDAADAVKAIGRLREAE